jgi:hypothetical protein
MGYGTRLSLYGFVYLLNSSFLHKPAPPVSATAESMQASGPVSAVTNR